MDYKALLHDLNINREINKRTRILKKLKSWVEFNHYRTYKKIDAIIQVLEEVKYDISKINPDILNLLKTKHSWKHPNTKKVRLYKFLRWLGPKLDLSLISFDKVLSAPRIQQLPLHQNLEKELNSLLTSWKSPMTKEDLKSSSKTCYIRHIKDLSNIYAHLHNGSRLSSFSELTKKDARDIKELGDNETTRHLITGRKIKHSTFNNKLTVIITIINRLFKLEMLENNYFAWIDINNVDNSSIKRPFLSFEDFIRITKIDYTALKMMDINQKYEYLFIRLAITLAFWGGLRISELVNIMIEDIGIAEILDDYVPLYIYAGKDRNSSHCDFDFIAYRLIKEILELYLEVLKEFIRHNNINTISTYSESRKSEVHYLFYSPYSKEPIIIPHIFAYNLEKYLASKGLGIFKKQTHIFKRGLVTHLRNNGFSDEEIMLKTRHKSIKMIRIYDRGGFEDIRKRIILADTKLKSLTIDKNKHSTSEEVNYQLFKLIEWLNSEHLIDIHPYQNVKDIVFRFNRHLIVDGRKARSSEYYYNWHDLSIIWGLSKTQTIKRRQDFIDAGIFYPCKSDSGEILILRAEMEAFNHKYVELTKAAISASYATKGKLNYLREQASAGKIAHKTIGRLIYLERDSSENWFNNLHRKTNE